MYENTMTAHAKAAEISVPVKVKIKQHVPWENENIIEKREMVKKVYEVCLRRNTRSSAARLKEAKQDLQESYHRGEKYVNEKIHDTSMANPNFYFKLHFLIVGGRHLITGSANIHCIDCIPHGNQFFFSHVSNR